MHPSEDTVLFGVLFALHAARTVLLCLSFGYFGLTNAFLTIFWGVLLLLSVCRPLLVKRGGFLRTGVFALTIAILLVEVIISPNAIEFSSMMNYVVMFNMIATLMLPTNWAVTIVLLVPICLVPLGVYRYAIPFEGSPHGPSIFLNLCLLWITVVQVAAIVIPAGATWRRIARSRLCGHRLRPSDEIALSARARHDSIVSTASVEYMACGVLPEYAQSLAQDAVHSQRVYFASCFMALEWFYVLIRTVVAATTMSPFYLFLAWWIILSVSCPFLLLTLRGGRGFPAVATRALLLPGAICTVVGLWIEHDQQNLPGALLRAVVYAYAAATMFPQREAHPYTAILIGALIITLAVRADGVPSLARAELALRVAALGGFVSVLAYAKSLQIAVHPPRLGSRQAWSEAGTITGTVHPSSILFSPTNSLGLLGDSPPELSATYIPLRTVPELSLATPDTTTAGSSPLGLALAPDSAQPGSAPAIVATVVKENGGKYSSPCDSDERRVIDASGRRVSEPLSPTTARSADGFTLRSGASPHQSRLAKPGPLALRSNTDLGTLRERDPTPPDRSTPFPPADAPPADVPTNRNTIPGSVVVATSPSRSHDARQEARSSDVRQSDADRVAQDRVEQPGASAGGAGGHDEHGNEGGMTSAELELDITRARRDVRWARAGIGETSPHGLNPISRSPYFSGPLAGVADVINGPTGGNPAGRTPYFSGPLTGVGLGLESSGLLMLPKSRLAPLKRECMSDSHVEDEAEPEPEPGSPGPMRTLHPSNSVPTLAREASQQSAIGQETASVGLPSNNRSNSSNALDREVAQHVGPALTPSPQSSAGELGAARHEGTPPDGKRASARHLPGLGAGSPAAGSPVSSPTRQRRKRPPVDVTPLSTGRRDFQEVPHGSPSPVSPHMRHAQSPTARSKQTPTPLTVRKHSGLAIGEKDRARASIPAVDRINNDSAILASSGSHLEVSSEGSSEQDLMVPMIDPPTQGDVAVSFGVSTLSPDLRRELEELRSSTGAFVTKQTPTPTPRSPLMPAPTISPVLICTHDLPSVLILKDLLGRRGVTRVDEVNNESGALQALANASTYGICYGVVVLHGLSPERVRDFVTVFRGENHHGSTRVIVISPPVSDPLNRSGGAAVGTSAFSLTSASSSTVSVREPSTYISQSLSTPSTVAGSRSASSLVPTPNASGAGRGALAPISELTVPGSGPNMSPPLNMLAPFAAAKRADEEMRAMWGSVDGVIASPVRDVSLIVRFATTY